MSNIMDTPVTNFQNEKFRSFLFKGNNILYFPLSLR